MRASFSKRRRGLPSSGDRRLGSSTVGGGDLVQVAHVGQAKWTKSKGSLDDQRALPHSVGDAQRLVDAAASAVASVSELHPFEAVEQRPRILFVAGLARVVGAQGH